jgi:hypothetical protein
MPSLDQKFECYLHQSKDSSLHPGLARVYASLPPDIKDAVHLLIHGPSGVGKYTQALLSLEGYSPTGLRYDKIMKIGDDKHPYVMRISDVHFEVDMETLGCHSRTLWSAIHSHVVDSVCARSAPVGFILCKNFHKTHKELLEVFYYYMSHKSTRFILLSEHVGFLPRKIVDRCLRIPVPRPAIARLQAAGLPDELVHNLKSVSEAQQQVENRGRPLFGNVLEMIIADETPDYVALRTLFYELLIRQHSVADCIWWVTQQLCEGGHCPPEKYTGLFERLCVFFRLYNNNYRPIYHLERVALSLRQLIRDSETTAQ